MMYVRTGTLRKWYFGIFFQKIHMYVRTELHTSIKLFVVPRESKPYRTGYFIWMKHCLDNYVRTYSTSMVQYCSDNIDAMFSFHRTGPSARSVRC